VQKATIETEIARLSACFTSIMSQTARLWWAVGEKSRWKVLAVEVQKPLPSIATNTSAYALTVSTVLRMQLVQ